MLLRSSFTRKSMVVCASALTLSLLSYKYKPNLIFTAPAMCQGGLDYHHDHVRTLNHISVVKHLLSILRDRQTNTKDFRAASDRIMRLLVEEVIGQELAAPVKRISPTGDSFDYYGLKNSYEDYCAVTILRAGDSMLGEVFNLLPGISIGKVLI